MIAPTALALMSALTFASFKGQPAPAPVQPGHRIAGTTAIRRPDLLQRKMNLEEQPETDYRGIVCVGADGVPRSIKTIQRTGVRQADQKVEKTVRGWRYARSWSTAGRAASAAGSATASRSRTRAWSTRTRSSERAPLRGFALALLEGAGQAADVRA